MFSALTSPVIFAHRGASSHAPENTLAAFQIAIDQGVKAIELDVQLTRDQEVVVFHDINIDRTTDGSGKVKDLSLSELKSYNAGIAFAPAYQREKIPTLAEVFGFLPEHIFINIELKNLKTPFDELPSRTASVIREFNAHDRVLISSFNTIALTRFSEEAPSIPRGLLVRSTLLATIHTCFPFFIRNVQSVHLPYKSLSPELIDGFKRMGLKVFSYTLNHTQDILRAAKMGIDGFFSDDPGFANRVLLQNSLQKP